MSFFFDAAWFDARLAQCGIDRNALAARTGIERNALHQLFANERAATSQELQALADALAANLVEVTLRAGVSVRVREEEQATPAARIEDIEARLDAIDHWLEEFERTRKRA